MKKLTMESWWYKIEKSSKRVVFRCFLCSKACISIDSQVPWYLRAFPGRKNVFYSSYWLKLQIWWVLHCYTFFHVFPLRHVYTKFLCLEMMYLQQISCLEYIFVGFSVNIVHFHALPHKWGLGINYARFTLDLINV